MLRLGDEFREDSDIIVVSLGVGVSQWAFQKSTWLSFLSDRRRGVGKVRGATH